MDSRRLYCRTPVRWFDDFGPKVRVTTPKSELQPHGPPKSESNRTPEICNQIAPNRRLNRILVVLQKKGLKAVVNPPKSSKNKLPLMMLNPSEQTAEKCSFPPEKHTFLCRKMHSCHAFDRFLQSFNLQNYLSVGNVRLECQQQKPVQSLREKQKRRRARDRGRERGDREREIYIYRERYRERETERETVRERERRIWTLGK